jgi:hypothetical protein
MRVPCAWGFAVLALLALEGNLAAAPRPCVSADQAVRMLNKDICVTAHIYDVVQLPDMTTFLDTCPPSISDEECRFTMVSLREDRDDVGDLNKYRNLDVHVRGVVRPMHGRAGMLLSHVRQFNGGPPKFKPNSRLAHGFNGEQSKPPISDSNLHSSGGHRAFMNTRDQELRPTR